MIEIANKHWFKGNGIYIGRPSILGNPFSHIQKGTLAKYKVGSREEAVNKYEIWLNEQENDSPVMLEIYRLAEEYKKTGMMTLICWCYPAKCHGNVIANKIKQISETLE